VPVAQSCRVVEKVAEVVRNLTAVADVASVAAADVARAAENSADSVATHPGERVQREEVVEEVLGIDLVLYDSLARKGAVFDMALVLHEPAKKQLSHLRSD
jgi:hypothetical protein